MQKSDMIDNILRNIIHGYDINTIYGEFADRKLDSKYKITKSDVKYRIKTLINNGYITENEGLLNSNFPSKVVLRDKKDNLILKYDYPIVLNFNLNDLIDKGVRVYHTGIANNLVQLSNCNSRIIESEIWHNPNYKCNFAKRIFDSFCIKGVFDRSNDAYFAVLRMIDIDNSTQVWKNSHSDFDKIYNYIIMNEVDFYNRLKVGDKTLIDDILKICDKDLLSFVSKICKYLNLWLFNKDDFYIFDYYVLNIIPYYLDYYKNLYRSDYPNDIEELWLKINDRNYEVIFKLLEFIHECRNKEFGDNISKDYLDHIMWYCYRSYAQDGKKIPCNLF